MWVGLTNRSSAVGRLAIGCLGACLLASPAWAQATSAGAPKAQAPNAAASSAAAAADGPATLLIKKKKKVVVKTPDAAAPAAAAATAATEQPPVPLDGAKAAEIPPANIETQTAAAADSAAPPAAEPPAAAVAIDPAKPKTMTKKTAKSADVTTTAAAPAKKADPAAKPNRKAGLVPPDSPAGGPTGCRTRAFTVNDYGKDGPTADAKRLLDADIASWSKANGLTNVTVGAKSVKCFQFLNFIVFDEWTCTASAKVCWK